MTVVLNLVLYLFFTAMCIFVARPPFLRKSSRPKISAVIKRLTFDKKTTTAICFCAAAKGLVVAYPVLEILYGGYDARERAIVSIPMVLYQGEFAPDPSPSRTCPDRRLTSRRGAVVDISVPDME
jgi:sodium/bile acid cotransporter 7